MPANLIAPGMDGPHFVHAGRYQRGSVREWTDMVDLWPVAPPPVARRIEGTPAQGTQSPLCLYQ